MDRLGRMVTVSAAAVAALLSAYDPASDERRIVEDFRELLKSPEPFRRSQFHPGHLTASGFVLSPDRVSLLLVHHRRLDRWLQPGGHIDDGDPSPVAAAQREVLEETGIGGLTPVVDGLFGLHHHPIPPRHDEPAHRHYDLQFAFLARDQELSVAEEVIDARWIPFEAVAALTPDTAVRRALRRLSAVR